MTQMIIGPDKLRELFQEMSSDIASSAVCDWGPELGGNEGEPHCEHEAEWAIAFRSICLRGAQMPENMVLEILLCSEHKNAMLAYLKPGAGYLCIACDGPLEGAHHVMKRMLPL